MTNDEQKIENSNPVMYVVVYGDYSDYKIVSLWSSEELAVAECEAQKGLGKGYDFRVEEYLLNTSALDGARRRVRGHYALLYLSTVKGEVTASDVNTMTTIFFGEDEDRAYVFEGNRKSKGHVSAYSESEENAVNLVLEKLAEFRAENREAIS